MIVSPRLTAITPLLAMRAPPTSMLAMPVATTVADGLVTAAGAGSIAIALQLMGVALIRAIPEDKRSIMLANSGYVVYKSVALLLIVVQTIIGALWYFPAVGATSASRLLAPDSTVRFLAAVVFGTLVMWDLPCAVFIKRNRKPDMIAHHVGVATIAFVMMAKLPNAFGLFYLGAQEISSVPVCVWNFYTNADDAAATPQWSERVSPPHWNDPLRATSRSLRRLPLSSCAASSLRASPRHGYCPTCVPCCPRPPLPLRPPRCALALSAPFASMRSSSSGCTRSYQ